jgi:hypothetical protein
MCGVGHKVRDNSGAVMDKRYQVFVSSTFADLVDERRSVMQTLLKMPCIPAGMELFPAKDEQQLDYIKRVIDNCDYYLLIVGGRYGSMTADGVSFTEKEYEYAVSKGLHVVALLHRNPEKLSFEKSEGDPAVRERLATFRTRVSARRLVDFWDSPTDLPGLVALSMQSAMTDHPAVGWIRANTAASEELLSDINQLRKENERLSKALAAVTPAISIPDLAGFDEPYRIFAAVTGLHGIPEVKNRDVTWRQIFYLVGPAAAEVTNGDTIRTNLGKELFTGKKVELNDQSFNTIGIQLQALGLIEIERLVTAAQSWGMFWKLTPLGARRLVEVRAVRTTVNSSPGSPTSASTTSVNQS